MLAKEKRSLWGTKRLLQDILPGDDESIKDLIYTYIGGFADPELSKQRFAELMKDYDGVN